MSARAQVRQELAGHQQVFQRALARALWDMDLAQLDALARGALDVPVIEQVRIRDPASGRVFVDMRKPSAPVGTATDFAAHRFPVRLLPAVQGVLGLQAKYEKPPLSDAMARIAKSGKVSRKDEAILAEDKIYNAFLRTTCVTTMLQASNQDNVLRPLH